MNSNNIWFFEDVNLFGMLCPHKFKEYKKAHDFMKFKKQDYIYFEKDKANKVYLIEKGKVKIGYYTKEGDEIVKSILSKGELFGEKAILGEEKREEFAKSVDDNTSVCPVDVNTMLDLMRDNRTFSFKIYKLIGFRIRRLERRLEMMLFKDARSRLMEFIDDLCTDYGYDCPDTGNKIIKHPYTQKEIACLIGTSRPTINVILNELKDKKVLDFNRNQITIYKKPA